MKPNKTPDPRFADWDLELPKTHNRVVTFEKQQPKPEAPQAKAGVSKAISASIQNPYLRARTEILTKYPEWRRNEIRDMEKTGNINNCHYDAFVKEVADLGDSYMPIHTVTF